MSPLGPIPRIAPSSSSYVWSRSSWLVAASSGRRRPVPADHAAAMARGLDLFKRDVRAILVKHCLKCHGGAATKGDFDLATREALLRETAARGRPSSPARRRRAGSTGWSPTSKSPAMPDKAAKLPDDADPADRRLDRRRGPLRPAARRDAAEPDAPTPSSPRPTASSGRSARWPTRRRPRSDAAWGRTPVDRFILAKLDAKGIAPNPPADRRTLIRRASFDLTGLPPTPEEVEAFVDDPRPDAYERLVDRLLASPHYGERWARHWLDLARFAESHGYEHDYDRPTAYHYRDFVIRALNEDMPYDRFVRLQVAGDELEPDNPQALMATGFLAAGVHSTQITANQAEKERYDELDDMAATLGTAMLGLTVGCARCHDHKFDPIPTADYYRLIATFTTTVRSEVDLDLDPGRRPKRHGRITEPSAELDPTANVRA